MYFSDNLTVLESMTTNLSAPAESNLMHMLLEDKPIKNGNLGESVFLVLL